MEKKLFGNYKGKEVFLYTLENEYLKAEIMTLGATLVSFKEKETDTDVVLGFDDLNGYLSQHGSYMGATIGRCANRIGNARFTLNGKDYSLAANNGPNSLHGGVDNFAYQHFQAEEKGEHLCLYYLSKDGEEGYPGNLVTVIEYYLEEHNLYYVVSGLSDQDTIFNITNHSYFNLDGVTSPSILHHRLTIPAKEVALVDENGLTTSEVIMVDGTAFDFREEKVIGDQLAISHPNVVLAHGFDHNFVYETLDVKNMATLKGRELALDVESDLPGMHVYTANFLDGEVKGKGNNYYDRHVGICFECQYYPDAIHHEDKLQPVLKKNTRKTHFIKYTLRKHGEVMEDCHIEEALRSGVLDEEIKMLICSEEIEAEKERYLTLLKEAKIKYGDGYYHILSSPGRVEIGGNHTDHQHGRVIAASVNVDNTAIVKANDSMVVRVTSPGFVIEDIHLEDLSPKEEEKETTQALIRGIASRLCELGYVIGGFDAYTASRVLVGSGISSSASFEVLIAEIFNHLFNEGKIDSITIAQVAQYAENHYFGKPCGLLDQMAISCGGFTQMDFKDPKEPIVKKIDFDFNDYGYRLVLVNTKGDHSDLSHEYAAIPSEMKMVARAMGHSFLRECSKEEFLKNVSTIRHIVGNDRALIRAMHFFHEDLRAEKEAKAIEEKDINNLLRIIRESGRSSYMYLQNIFCTANPKAQAIALALALSDDYLKEEGAFRVHGGGFEGTIQAIVPEAKLEGYLALMHSVFGEDATFLMSVRPVGGYRLI